MLLSSKLPVATLAQWSRALKHGLDIGLSPVRVFRQQAKGGPPAGRTLAADLADRLEKGTSLEDALAEHRSRFPVMFLELTALGEQTGRLTETFAELERHYDDAIATRKQFASALMYPAFMYVSAVCIVALMVLILGLIGGLVAPLGKSMLGVPGAIAVLAGGFLLAAAVVVTFWIARENEPIRGKLEALSLRVPGVGGCFRAFALHRFSTALHMTGEAGLRMDRALRLSFRATANEAYQGLAEPAAVAVKKGSMVQEALEPGRGRLFPDEFLDAVHLGETTGRLPEVMGRQAAAYRDEAARKMKLLAQIASWAVYAAVGLLLIVMIVRTAQVAYIGPMNDAMNAADNPEAWLRGGR